MPLSLKLKLKKKKQTRKKSELRNAKTRTFKKFHHIPDHTPTTNNMKQYKQFLKTALKQLQLKTLWTIQNCIEQKPSNKLTPKTPAAQLALPNLSVDTYSKQNQNPRNTYQKSRKETSWN